MYQASTRWRYLPMTFEKVDESRFPALRLGIEAGKRGGAAPAVFNGANECAVAAFLAGRITYNDIHRGISSALDAYGDNAERPRKIFSPPTHRRGDT